MEKNERSLQREAVETLQFIASALRYRADFVRFAVSAGIPKRQVHQITGLARTTIDRMAAESPRYAHPCDYCLHDHFQQLRHGEAARPIDDARGYLVYRIGDRPEAVAQKLCDKHRDADYEWLSGITSARWIWVPHTTNTPSQIVYSLGGVRDDRGLFEKFFSNFPEWDKKIAPLLAPA